MYKGQKVSVVMPAFNEEAGVASTVQGFCGHEYVDEVIVVDNNSTDDTAELAERHGAVVVYESRQGYGYACRTGLERASGDLIVLTESDDSFYPGDLEILFAYSPYFDMVKGARSNCNLVTRDADWTFALMFGNWALAKYMQLLYFGRHSLENAQLREMGGTFRVMKRESLHAILPYVREGQSAFLPELTTIALRNRQTVLEVPVRYRRRLGTSKITGNRWKAFLLALRMLAIVTANRFRTFPPLEKRKDDSVSQHQPARRRHRVPETAGAAHARHGTRQVP